MPRIAIYCNYLKKKKKLYNNSNITGLQLFLLLSVFIGKGLERQKMINTYYWNQLIIEDGENYLSRDNKIIFWHYPLLTTFYPINSSKLQSFPPPPPKKERINSTYPMYNLLKMYDHNSKGLAKWFLRSYVVHEIISSKPLAKSRYPHLLKINK